MDDSVRMILGSEQYERSESTLRAEFVQVEIGLQSDDVGPLRAAARRLRSLAAAELGWFRLSVRTHFLTSCTQRHLEALLLGESDNRTRLDLLRALRFASERLIDHPMWAPIANERDAAKWRTWLTRVAEEAATSRDSGVRAEAGYVLVASGKSCG
ncbi:hypothetical protein ATY41_03910 [Leifsonia xyli subsp. xyli]|uniref:Uncharacterized protein n=1 Tax=Leifsonia xyli subsp. xyli TaxID=59736 RepID=A0A1E2SIX4_LEIXY|nr:hypothetical protein ATY41_03910 [Leifsonia xyli subsp. xyli]